MSLHIAIVGNGRIGRPTSYTLFNEMLADKISLVDTKPGMAWAFGEELKHVAASLKYDVEINAYEKDEEVSGADLVVVCPGKPRIPGVDMDRRELLGENAKIINYIAEVMPSRNPAAKWVVVTNPADAMASLFKKVSGKDFVIGTGNHADTLRFRAKLAIDLGVPVSKVEGFIGGEHGSSACALWSTVKIGGKSLSDYLAEAGKKLDKDAVIGYVRGVSKKIVDIIGGTEVGPAAGFRDIIRSIIQNRQEIYSIADSVQLPGLPGPINVNIPTRVGQRIGPNFWNELPTEEQKGIIEASKVIHKVYLSALKAVGKI